MKIFGTDGARGIVNKELTGMLAYKIGASVTRVLKNGNDKNLKFFVASDTRISKDMLRNALCAGVLSENGNITDLGVLPTPAISYFINKYNYDGGFVISASHNPSQYNGIKVFNNKGLKLDDNIIDSIEYNIHNFIENESINATGLYSIKDDAINEYVDFLCSTINTDISKLHIGIDSANGAAYLTSKLLFDKLNVKYEIINDNPNGININDKAGSTHIEGLQELVKSKGLDCGIAYDGDADRCIMVDNLGNVIDGDFILSIYSKYLKDNNKLRNNTIVGTVMSNLGLRKYCEKNNINFESTAVGDRFILENMLSNDYILGGEQSGHIIFKEYLNTGDGELTSLQMLSVIAKTNKTLSELSKCMDKYPQVLMNVNVSKEFKDTYKNNIIINNFIKEKEVLLNNEGRILVRPSGTENLVRVMIEGKDINFITIICEDICNIIKQESDK